eukprot:1097128-Rhodomonas_salina.1
MRTDLPARQWTSTSPSPCLAWSMKSEVGLNQRDRSASSPERVAQSFEALVSMRTCTELGCVVARTNVVSIMRQEGQGG